MSKKITPDQVATQIRIDVQEIYNSMYGHDESYLIKIEKILDDNKKLKKENFNSFLTNIQFSHSESGWTLKDYRE